MARSSNMAGESKENKPNTSEDQFQSMIGDLMKKFNNELKEAETPQEPIETKETKSE